MDCNFWDLPLICHWWVTPQKTEQSIVLGLCSEQQLLFLPSWIEPLFLIIITLRSPNLVENFLFYE